MNNYDEMKKFLNISRSGAIKKVIREDQGQYYDQQKETKRDLTPDEIEGEKQEFAANVSKLVEFNDFKLGYDNASWSGVFPKEKIEWIYSLDADQGVYISCEMSQLTDGTLELIQNLEDIMKLGQKNGPVKLEQKEVKLDNLQQNQHRDYNKKYIKIKNRDTN